MCAALLHLATSWRYGYFRDELYFIACAKHLAWGYVDQPPFVALAAWLSAPGGYHLVALRLLPALAAGATVYVAMALRENSAADGSPCSSPASRRCSPGLPTARERVDDDVVRAAVVDADDLRRDKNRSRAFGERGPLVAAAGRSARLRGVRQVFDRVARRRIGGRHRADAATARARVAVAPAAAHRGAAARSQSRVASAHGWPFVEVLRGDAAHRPAFQSGAALEYRDLARNAAAFVLEQIVYTNVCGSVWIAGIVAPFRASALRDLRFVRLPYAVVVAVAVALGAKGYYVIGIYASLVAIGAVAVERGRAWRIARRAALLLTAAAALPLSLPILPVDALIAYSQGLGLTGRGGTPPHLVQPVFAEEFGWERLARDVAAVYHSLPPRVRAGTAVYADTYGDAGALDFYGPRYGLPPAISSQNSYYLWGTRGYDGRTMVAVGATRIDLLRRIIAT